MSEKKNCSPNFSLMDGDQFKVRVKPNASANSIVGWKEGVLHVEVKAPADKGKANNTLVRFLSKEFGRRLRIVSGVRSREKLLVVIS